MTYKTWILKYSPAFLQKRLRDMYFAIKLMPGYVYDFVRFFTYAGLNKSRDDQIQRAARMTLYAHQVEKGLSLAAPRLGFGMTVIPTLLDDIARYMDDYGLDTTVMTALAALNSYVAFHHQLSHPVDHVAQRLDDMVQQYQLSTSAMQSWQGGVTKVNRQSLESARDNGFSTLFASRHSVRQFSGEAIPENNILRAVKLAQKTPSVCNRQSWRVHAFSKPADMAALLAIQGGGRGFAEHASVILVVTTELGSFLGIAERYQAWIDGGMFSMSLCLAFHDLGYGTCCLNWSKEPSTDRAMRKVAPIPASEQIVMLIAVGTLPEEFTVACSYRPPVTDLLVMH